MKATKFLFPLDLQFFSADGAGDGDSGNSGTEPADNNQVDANNDAQQNDNQAEKTFTQEELDRIISSRLAKERAKWEKEFETKLNEAKTEAEKLAKMNAEQKAEYERNKREEELERREAEITRRELRATAIETLAEKGLPKQLADILDYTDAEKTNKSIENVEKVFREAVELAVNEKLRGGNPPKGGQGTTNLEAQIAKYFED